jgi:peptidoglycan/xylan/chitin deacetylase (PgdA/CDA1 family)
MEFMRMHLQAKVTRSLTQRVTAVFAVTLLLAASMTPVFGAPKASAATVAQNFPKISFTFDDGLESAINIPGSAQYSGGAEQVLAQNGIVGTDYVITGCADQVTDDTNGSVVPCNANPSATYMSWAQVEQLQADGWEIGSHTVTHPQMAVVDGSPTTGDGSLPGGAAQVITELTQSKADLATHGINATDFAWPYGDYDNAAMADAAKYYATTRGFADSDGNTLAAPVASNSTVATGSYAYNDLLLHDQQFQESPVAKNYQLCSVKGVLSVPTAETCINNAITNNQWLVFVFHNVTETPDLVAADQSYDTTPEDLNTIAAYAAAKQKAGLANIVTVNQGIVTGTNLMPNGEFTNGLDTTDPVRSPNGWTTSDPTDITLDTNNNGRFPDPQNSILLKSAANATASSSASLFSPQIAVTSGTTYDLKNYVNITSGVSVNFSIDEFNSAGQEISSVDPGAGIAYKASNTDVADIDFSYTPSSASVTSASLQVIVKGKGTQAYYSGAQWFIPGSTSTAKPGDVNGDGTVGLADLRVLSKNYGMTTGATLAQGDLNGDGAVNLADLRILSKNWSN